MRGTLRPWAVLAALVLFALALSLAWLTSAPSPNPEPPSPVAVAGAERSTASAPQAARSNPDDGSGAGPRQTTLDAAHAPEEPVTWTSHAIRAADAAWCRRLSEHAGPAALSDPTLIRGVEQAQRTVWRWTQHLLRQQPDARAHALADHLAANDPHVPPESRSAALERLRSWAAKSEDPAVLIMAANGCDNDTTCRIALHERIVRLAPQNAAAWVPLLGTVEGETQAVREARQRRALRALAQASELRGGALYGAERLLQLIRSNSAAWPQGPGAHEAAAFELMMQLPGTALSVSLPTLCGARNAPAECGPALEALWRLDPPWMFDRLVLTAATRDHPDLPQQPTWAARVAQVDAVRSRLLRDQAPDAQWVAACDPERPLAQRLQATLTEGDWVSVLAEQTAADRRRAP